MLTLEHYVAEIKTLSFPVLNFCMRLYCSDHIALLKAFEGWKEAKRSGKERSFCWENFLSPVTLQMMDDMRMQFLNLLSDIGFVDKSKGPSVCPPWLYFA